jgi:uncharacterized cupredoxin-like copper-binding protein
MKNLNTTGTAFTKTLIGAAVFALALNTSMAIAGPSGGGGHGHGHSGDNGEPGKKSQVTRTIKVEMYDNYFKPEKFNVKKGETIRFIVANKGRLVHEFNVGTHKQHMAHQKEMMMMIDHGVLEADKINHDKMKMKMPNGETMEHNDPNSVLLEPGKTGDIIWKFSKKADLEIGCNVPGHYDAGMVGKVTFK